MELALTVDLAMTVELASTVEQVGVGMMNQSLQGALYPVDTPTSHLIAHRTDTSARVVV